MTWGGAGLLMVVFLATLPHLEQVVQAWGFVPQLWDRHWGLTLLTSFFLHGGVFHLLSNLYFFVIFGDNVEDHLGPLCFVLLLLGAEVFGSLTHAALDPRGDIPTIGASGGISGILGYYAATFPRVRVGFFWFFPFFRWIHLPAWVMLLLFSLLQLLGAWIQMYGGGGVSYAAHLGGLAVGVAVALSVHGSSPSRRSLREFACEGHPAGGEAPLRPWMVLLVDGAAAHRAHVAPTFPAPTMVIFG